MTQPPAKSLAAVHAEGRDQDQRWAAIYYGVKRMASAAHHDDYSTLGFVWQRADTEAILAATTGLVVRFTAE